MNATTTRGSREVTITVAVPGTLYAALAVCTPGGPPAWLAAAAPHCATGHRGVLQLNDVHAAQLADLAAAVWWECQQADGDGEPFTTVFAQACEAVLDSLAAARHT